MYFKQAGHKIQVLAYRGYDKEKKRAIVKMVGSISGRVFTPTDRHKDSITDAEREEIKTYIESVRQGELADTQKWSFDTLPLRMEEAIAAVKSGERTEIDSRWAEAVWTQMDELGCVLRKAGYGKHKLLRKDKTIKKPNKTSKGEK